MTLSHEIARALPRRVTLYRFEPADTDLLDQDPEVPQDLRRKVFELQAALGPAFSVAFDNELALSWGCYLLDGEFWMVASPAARARPRLFLESCRTFVYITMQYHQLQLGRMRAKSADMRAIRFGKALMFHVEQSATGPMLEMIRRQA